MTFFCISEGNDVFFHADIDDFEPETMLVSGKNKFELTRAVPPRKIEFFFSELNDCQVTSTYEKVNRKIEKNMNLNDLKKLIVVDTINVLVPDGVVCMLKSSFYTKPRTKSLSFRMPEAEMQRIQ